VLESYRILIVNSVNIVAIHLADGMYVKKGNQTVCYDSRNNIFSVTSIQDNQRVVFLFKVCGYHSFINISSLTGGKTQRLRYTVVGYTSSKKSCSVISNLL
jgi:hypothetical protein